MLRDSLILKCLEFGAVAKLQALSHLDEHSIGMTQKMDKVAVPIKIRAILKGVATGWNDRFVRLMVECLLATDAQRRPAAS